MEEFNKNNRAISITGWFRQKNADDTEHKILRLNRYLPFLRELDNMLKGDKNSRIILPRAGAVTANSSDKYHALLNRTEIAIAEIKEQPELQPLISIMANLVRIDEIIEDKSLNSISHTTLVDMENAMNHCSDMELKSFYETNLEDKYVQFSDVNGTNIFKKTFNLALSHLKTMNDNAKKQKILESGLIEILSNTLELMSVDNRDDLTLDEAIETISLKNIVKKYKNTPEFQILLETLESDHLAPEKFLSLGVSLTGIFIIAAISINGITQHISGISNLSRDAENANVIPHKKIIEDSPHSNIKDSVADSKHMQELLKNLMIRKPVEHGAKNGHVSDKNLKVNLPLEY